MIVVNCAMLHDKLVSYVEAIEDPRCTFVSQTRMEVLFKTTDDDRALGVIKAALKATPDFKTVYFQISRR